MLQVETWETFFHIMFVGIHVLAVFLIDSLIWIWTLNNHNNDRQKFKKSFCSHMKKRITCYKKDNKFAVKIYSFVPVT